MSEQRLSIGQQVHFIPQVGVTLTMFIVGIRSVGRGKFDYKLAPRVPNRGGTNNLNGEMIWVRWTELDKIERIKANGHRR